MLVYFMREKNSPTRDIQILYYMLPTHIKNKLNIEKIISYDKATLLENKKVIKDAYIQQ